MREFNTSGPCDPALHYTVMRRSLMQKGLEKVQKGRYFTIFAPRQTGKTTYFQLLMADLLKNGFLPVWVSLENLKTATKAEFYMELNKELQYQFGKYGIELPFVISSHIILRQVFEKWQRNQRQIVLIIDEFEGTPDAVLSELMHTFRKIYHQRDRHCLHALMLVGVSTIAELVVSHASPFNIADELELPYFSLEEVQDLIGQYVNESGQMFEADLIQAIYANTNGQPGLVCALCQYIVENVATDRSQPAKRSDYDTTQQHFLTEHFDKHIINIVQKAREKKDFMLTLLFGENPIPFTIHDPDIAWLYANGVLDRDNGNADVRVPLYKKVLITAFRPLLNGEARHYVTSTDDMLKRYLQADGSLNIDALLDEYRLYVRRRGFLAFDTEHLKEAACHYSLDGFITFFIQRLGGEIFIEVPSGKGRADILIRYKDRSYIIEIKIYSEHTNFKQGKVQLSQYLISENLPIGYYVVFSSLHTDKDTLFTQEIIAGKQVHTHIVPLNFETPSRMHLSPELKLSKADTIAINMLKKRTFSNAEIAELTGVKTERIESLSVLFKEG